MTRSSIIHTLAVAVVLFGAGQAVAGDPTKAEAESAIAAAEAARAAAAEAKYEWTTTGPLIDEAKAALEAGKHADAVALANKAKMQGDAAVSQARREHEGWKQSVVR